MNRDVRLLYFEGCPNVEQARANLRAALAQTGLPARWQEIDIKAPDCPTDWRGFPSPMVLVDGSDVATDARAQAGASACRMGGAPTAERIASALKDRSWFASLAALPAAAIGLVPAAACPACYPALAGLLSALGLGAFAQRILAPLTLILLLVALAGLAYQGKRRNDYRPLAIGALGAAALYAGQFLLLSAVAKGFGIALLVGASFWNILPRIKRPSGESCSACVEGR